MPSSLLPDPMQLWRDALARIESGIEALATGRLKSHRILRTLHALAAASRSLQQLSEKLTHEGWHRLNLPTHRDIAALEAKLRRIDDKLDRLLAPDASETPPAAKARRTSAMRSREASAAPKSAARRSSRRRQNRHPVQNGNPT